jgi:hypothetical protein
MQRRLVVRSRRFGKTYRSNFAWVILPLKMEPTGCPEKSVTTNLLGVAFQNIKNLIYPAAEAWSHAINYLQSWFFKQSRSQLSVTVLEILCEEHGISTTFLMSSFQICCPFYHLYSFFFVSCYFWYANYKARQVQYFKRICFFCYLFLNLLWILIVVSPPGQHLK